MTGKPASQSASRWRHLNKVRWLSLALVFSMTAILPILAVYQTLVSAHAYDLLAPDQVLIYDTVERATRSFAPDPETDLDVIKGTTWSGTFSRFKMSDPLAVLAHIAATKTVLWSFAITALLPLIATLLFGRIFCGWICPANFIYELNSNIIMWFEHHGIRFNKKHIDTRLKYLVLLVGLILSAYTGVIWIAAIYPPAIIGRELYFAIALGGFGGGAVFFLLTVMLDTFVQRRAFCRYLCPGGALYSLLGRYRLVRIQRSVNSCDDCVKCNLACEFGLDPMNDHFGQECNNCTACIAACPVDALTFKVSMRDQAAQGPGHKGPRYLKNQKDNSLTDSRSKELKLKESNHGAA